MQGPCKEGQWDTQSCAQGCYDSKQCNICTPGETVCDNNKLKTCQGYTWNIKKCETACITNSNNIAECKCAYGSTECISQYSAAVCQIDGTKKTISCPFGCNNITCYPECTPGNKCVGNTANKCDSDGFLEVKNCDYGCNEQTGNCYPECTPGNTCDGNKANKCDSDGYLSIEDCEVGCDAETGQCAENCTPGYKCVGDESHLCDSNGSTSVDKCDYGCNAGTGQCNPECRPGKIKCESDKSYTCNSDGKWKIESCKVGCFNGKCAIESNCNSGDTTCLDNTTMAICYSAGEANSYYVSIPCDSFNSSQCSGNVCSKSCTADACIPFDMGTNALYLKIPCNNTTYDYINRQHCFISTCQICVPIKDK